MKYKVSIDNEKILGAIAVLENYLDGAVADYEDGQVENTGIISDCIYVHKILELILTHGFSSLEGDEYEIRFNKRKEESNE